MLHVIKSDARERGRLYWVIYKQLPLAKIDKYISWHTLVDATERNLYFEYYYLIGYFGRLAYSATDLELGNGQLI